MSQPVEIEASLEYVAQPQRTSPQILKEQHQPKLQGATVVPAPVLSWKAQKKPLQALPNFLSGKKAYTAMGVASLFAAVAIANPHLVPAQIGELLIARPPILNVLLLGAFFLIWSRILGFFDVSAEREGGIAAIVLSCSVASLAALALRWGDAEIFSMGTVLLFWVISVAALLGLRSMTQTLRRPVENVPGEARRVVIVGSGPRAARLYRQMKRGAEKYEWIGFVDDVEDALPADVGRLMVGRLSELERLLMREVVDEVLIALPMKSRYAEIQQTIDVCERVGVESRYLADLFSHKVARPQYEANEGASFVTMSLVHRDYRVRLKRVLDIVGSGLGILVLSPLFLAVAIAIKLTSPGAVFFVQERCGLGKRRFPMYKFRTMVEGAERMQAELEEHNEVKGPVFKIKEDPRVTRIGKLLRRSSIDELPQLFNVFKGDMSLVGPRPLPIRDVHLFDEPCFMRRFSVRPGITCLWQIQGRSNLDFDDWVALDLSYIDSWSLGLDLKILVRTLPAVVKGVGAC